MSLFGNAYRGRRVLVTGHTGFKGSWLTTWLLKLGADVVGVAKDLCGDYRGEVRGIVRVLGVQSRRRLDDAEDTQDRRTSDGDGDHEGRDLQRQGCPSPDSLQGLGPSVAGVRVFR